MDKRNHWEKTSHSLLVGAILHVLYAEADKTLAGVANFLSDPKRPVEATLRAMMNTPHLGEAGVHPVIASSARELLNTVARTATLRGMPKSRVIASNEAILKGLAKVDRARVVSAAQRIFPSGHRIEIVGDAGR